VGSKGPQFYKASLHPYTIQFFYKRLIYLQKKTENIKKSQK